MKNLFVLSYCIVFFLISCKSSQNKKETPISSVNDTNSTLSGVDAENGETITYQIGDKVLQNVLWQNLLFKLSHEELSKLNGNVDGVLVHAVDASQLEDVELILVDSKGIVVQKLIIGKDGGFSFKKLPSDDYTFILSKKDPAIQAKLLESEDNTIPVINSSPDKNYIFKNTFRKLSKDEFLADFNTIEITLTGVPQKQLNDLTLMILDQNGKVIEKVITNGRSKFVFQKLPRGNYTVLIHNGNKGIQANIRVMADDSKLPLEANVDQTNLLEPELNSIPNKTYLLKHTLKKLSRDEFTKKYARVQVNLKAEGKQSWDNLVLLILDEDGKVIEKVVSNGKDHFVFEKLPQGNYSFLIHNKPDNLQAEIRLIEDEPLVVKETPVVPEPAVIKEIPGEAEYKDGMHEYYKLNFTKALSHFHEAEKKENPNVFFLLGRLYDSGEGVTINNEKAFHYYEKGVSHGDVKANAGLALLYLEGKGVRADTVKANSLFHKALPAIMEKANEGDLFWMTRLGTLYNFGFGVKEDYKEAAKWYSKAADRGYAFAQFNLGVMYENGLGVKQDYAVALKLYQKAVEQGDVDAEFKMGVMYANGYGVERNYTEALKWYTKAASYGYADAQYNIGVLHANGLGVDKNFEEAIKWYKKAADQGFPDAEYNLAVMYAKGQGVKKDNNEAVKWYKLAAKKGVEEAQKLLKKRGIDWN